LDDFTLRCLAQGIVYLPIPAGSANVAGLLSVQLPESLQPGQVFNILVRQITNAVAAEDTGTRTAAIALTPTHSWRRVLGTFQVTVPVRLSHEMLGPEQRALSVLRWILASTPMRSRFYPVLQRYVGEIADRVTGLGGDPGLVYPSPNGNWSQPYSPPPPRRGGRPGQHAVTGKVDALFYDRFGDFEGFRIATEHGGERDFDNRELAVERLVREAWEYRITMSVYFDAAWPRRILRLGLR
jgi:hypothetical protein